MLLNIEHDPMGVAIQEYFEKGKAKTLVVASSMFDDDEMPVAHLFRIPMEMNELERLALSVCKGKVLDVGAGAGCHAMALQEKGFEVTAIDISPLSVETMRRRGIVNATLADFFTYDFSEKYDTILMLMNGIGIVGRVKCLPDFFKRLDEILKPGGCLLTDSSDLRYVFEDDMGNFDAGDFKGYYGEVDFCMRYGKVVGRRFEWLYLDAQTFRDAAEKAGYIFEILREGDHYDYLARITKLVTE